MTRRAMPVLLLSFALLFPALARAAFDDAFRFAWQRAREGYPAEALLKLNDLVGRLPEVPDAQRRSRAEKLCRALEYLGDRDAAAKLRQAEAARGRAPQVAPAAEQAPVNQRENADACFALASDASIGFEMQQQLFAQALAAYEKLPVPLPARDLQRKGRCHLELSQLEPARAALTEALRLDESDPFLRFALARVAWASGDRATANARLAEGLAVTLAPEGLRLLCELLRDLRIKGRADEALSLSKQWTDRMTDGLGALVVLQAEILEERGRVLEALPMFLQALANGGGPLSAGGAARSARQLASQGPKQLEAATSLITRTIPPAPEQPVSLLLAAADLLRDSGQLTGALGYYKAGYKTDDRALFQTGLTQLRNRFEKDRNVEQAMEAARVLRDFSEHRVQQTIAALKELDVTSVRIFEALLEARQDPKKGDHALELALAGSMPAWGKEQYRDGKIPQTSFPQRHQLLTPFVRGDTAGALKALRDFEKELVPKDAATAALYNDLGFGTRREDLQKAIAALNTPGVKEKEKVRAVMEVAHKLPSPIGIDLDGNGRLDLSSVDRPAGAVAFDLGGWGHAQQIQWLTGSDGWLCEDLDGDGCIRSGLELFGTAGGFKSGWAKLALRDRNADGIISDPELDGLSIWVDRNADGNTDAGELTPAASAGLSAIAIPESGLQSCVTLRGVTRFAIDVWPVVFRLRAE